MKRQSIFKEGRIPAQMRIFENFADFVPGHCEDPYAISMGEYLLAKNELTGTQA